MNKTPIALACLALLAGCSITPDYDRHFGSAVRHDLAAMALNPAPAASTDASGMDGQAAQLATLQYHESFKAPPPVVNVINIGGATSSR